MKIRIHVTKDVIVEARYCRAPDVGMNCAIAVAVRDMFPNTKVRATHIAFFTSSWDYIKSAKLPEQAQRLIRKFDKRSPDERVRIKPLSFDIDVPDSVIDGIGISEVERILSESKTLEKV